MKTEYIKTPSVEETADLTATERALFAAITYRCALFETDERTNAELAKDQGRHYVTMSKALAGLKDKGYITITGRTSARRIGVTYKGAAVSAYSLKAIYNDGEQLPKHSTRTPAVKLADIIAGTAKFFYTNAKSALDGIYNNAKSDQPIHLIQIKTSTSNEAGRLETLIEKGRNWHEIFAAGRIAAAMQTTNA